MEPITFTPVNARRFLELYPDLEAWSEDLLKDEDPGIQEIGEDLRLISEYLKAMIPEAYIVSPKPLPPMLGACMRSFRWRGSELVKSFTLNSEQAQRYNDLIYDLSEWGRYLREQSDAQIQEIGAEVEQVESFLIDLTGISVIQKPPPPMLGSCHRSLVWKGGVPQ